MRKSTLILMTVLLSPLFIQGTASQANNIPLTDQSSGEYCIQWEKNYGYFDFNGPRYQGPKPIGDCDNDGQNELLIGGKDNKVSIMKWDKQTETYHETAALRNPFYPFIRWAPGGWAIGDVTGDGYNEIVVSWFSCVYTFNNDGYELIAWNPWIELTGGECPDVNIGDVDHDGKNEIIVCTRDQNAKEPSVPEIVVYEWTGDKELKKIMQYDDPNVLSEVFMAGIGDSNHDGKMEIIFGSDSKIVVLQWNNQQNSFDVTSFNYDPMPNWGNHPFAVVCTDSDMDGLDEIHVGYYSPRISIFEWTGEEYQCKFEIQWDGEGPLIEGMDVGDIDGDGLPEVCAGTDVVHILQWDGQTYSEEALLPTFGDIAAVNIGDCDNDGNNELFAASVWVARGTPYYAWVFKNN